ncbi:MAG: LysM peptidoglycan-binding domain-containing protein [Desulfohalobiaceae bacterium]
MPNYQYFFKTLLLLALAAQLGLLAACAPLSSTAPGQQQGSQAQQRLDPGYIPVPQDALAAEGASLGRSRLQSSHTLQDLDQDILRPLEPALLEPLADLPFQPILGPSQRKALRTEPEISFELDLRETKVVGQYIQHYTQKNQEMFQRWVKRAERYLPYIRKVFTEHGLPQDLIFLPFAESGFDPKASSRSGASGIWQFMPDTARSLDLNVDWWIDERRDPYLSTHAAASYLNELYDQFGDWYLVLAAYNAGQGTVSRALRHNGQDCFFALQERKHLPRETRNYVPKFMAVLKIMRNLQNLGFEPLSWDAPDQANSLELPQGSDLQALASAVGLKWSRFIELNPAFRRSASPPERKTKVYLPQELLAQAREHLQDPSATPYSGLQRYQVRSGDSWWTISRRFDVPMKELKRMNQTQSNTLQPGQSVLIPAQAQSDEHLAQGKDFTGSYTVQKGDNLWDIAARSDCSVQELRSANKLQPGQPIRPGQELRIPQGQQGSTQEIAQRRANYTVQKGDSLWSLARRFDVGLQTLIQANGLQDQPRLRIGNKLYIPDLEQGQEELARSKAEAAHAELVNYQVQKGDSLWDIARKFGVSTKELLAWNELRRSSQIRPGDQIKIYLD